MQQVIDTQATDEAASTLSEFMGNAQMAALSEACAGEEGAHFAEMLVKLAAQIEAMPVTYDQDGKGEEAVAHLHYFMGGMDWYITERDMEDEQLQAFGLADLGTGYPEVGYISLQEITANGAELDLHWSPRSLATIKRMKGA